MIRLVCLPALSLFSLAGLAFTADPAQAQPDNPAEQYTALMREYRPASSAMRRATTDLERKQAVEGMAAFRPKFLEFAERHRDDPMALEALKQSIQVVDSTDSAALIAWESNSSEFPTGISDGSASRIVKLVSQRYLQSPDLAPLCDRLRYGYRPEFAGLLRTILAESPHANVQGVACIALAQYLSDKTRMVGLLEDRPELATCYEAIFGKDYIPQLRKLADSTEIEKLFERAAEEYADVKMVFGGKVGTRAKRELYELRTLAVGLPAPEIEGVDQDGTSFKLSDYRGKVVLLYFWMEI